MLRLCFLQNLPTPGPLPPPKKKIKKERSIAFVGQNTFGYPDALHPASSARQIGDGQDPEVWLIEAMFDVDLLKKGQILC